MLDQFRAQKLEWNRANNQIYDRVETSSGDSNGRTLFVQISNGGTVEDLTGATLSLAWSKRAEQGLESFEEVDAKKGQYQLFYPTGMLANHGVLQASLVLVDVTGRIESKPFDIIVHKGTVDDEAVESDNKFTALTTALVKVSQVQAEFDGLYADKSQMMDTLHDDKKADMEALEADYSNRANTLEATYAPRLTEVSAQLAQTPKKEDVFLKAYGININDLDEPTRQAFLEAQGIDVNYILGEGNVKPINTTFFRKGKNLFNKNFAEIDKAVNEVYGTLFPNTSYVASEFIGILPSTQYTENSSLYLAFYDSNHTFISGLGLVGDGTKARTFTTPENAKYVRVTAFKFKLDSYQLEKGNSQTAYEPFKQFIPSSLVEEKPFDVDDIPDGALGAEKAEFFEVSKNKFDKSKITLDTYVNWDNGHLDTSTAYATSYFIPVVEGMEYTRNKFVRSLGYYNGDGIFIAGIDSPPKTFTIPLGVRYTRVSLYKEGVDTFQLEQGDVETPYEKFGYVMDNSYLKNPIGSDELLVFLPAEICVAVGRTIELYNKQVVWCGNIDNYHIKWDCSVGKAMKRKFSVTGMTVGEHNLTLTIYDNNMRAVATKTTRLKIVSSTIATAKNLLTIGDSLTNSKAWLRELRTLSGDRITNVGTRGTTNKHEGRSGWSAATYLTGASYTFESEGVNPFWDGTRFNWNHYKTETGIDPGAVQIFLGTNGMQLDPTTNANNIKKIVDYIRQDDANIPIFVVNTLYRGNQNGIGNEIGSDGYSYNKGAWKLEEDRKVFNLMVRLYELLKSYSNLHFVPIALAHDSEYNFGALETPVNPRAIQTMIMPSEATHPQLQGYQQFADIMFSVMAKHLSA